MKPLLIYIYIAWSLVAVSTGGLAFNVIRYKEATTQIETLRSEVSELKNNQKQLLEKLGNLEVAGKEPSAVNDYFAPPSQNDSPNLKSKMENLEKKISVLSEKVDGPPTQGVNSSQSPAQNVSGDAFQDMVNKAVQNSFNESRNKRSENNDKRLVSFLEKELQLTPAQEDAISKILDERRIAVKDLWNKNTNDPNVTVQQTWQQSQQISQDAENKIKSYLDSTQLTQYNKLKDSGGLDNFGGWGGGHGGGPTRDHGGARQ